MLTKLATVCHERGKVKKKKYDHVNIVLYGKKPYLKKNPNITFIDNLTSCSDTTCKLQCTRAQILLHCTVLNYVLN